MHPESQSATHSSAAKNSLTEVAQKFKLIKFFKLFASFASYAGPVSLAPSNPLAACCL